LKFFTGGSGLRPVRALGSASVLPGTRVEGYRVFSREFEGRNAWSEKLPSRASQTPLRRGTIHDGSDREPRARAGGGVRAINAGVDSGRTSTLARGRLPPRGRSLAASSSPGRWEPRCPAAALPCNGRAMAAG